MGIFLLWHRQHDLALLYLLFAFGSLSFVVFGHYEHRYFFWCIPPAALLAGGGIVEAGRKLKLGQNIQFIGIILIALVLAYPSIHFARSIKWERESHTEFAELVNWVNKNTKPTDRFISVDTFALAWHTERATMAMPSTSPESFARVGRYYRITYFIAGHLDDTEEVREMVREQNPTILPFFQLFQPKACLF